MPPEQRLVGQHLVQAVQEHSGEYLIGLSDQFQTQVVPYSGRLAEARSSFEDPSLQQHDGLLDDPVLVLGSDGGKRLQAGVIDGERHGEPPDGEIGGHSPWEATLLGNEQGASITAAAVIVRGQDARRTGLWSAQRTAP